MTMAARITREEHGKLPTHFQGEYIEDSNATGFFVLDIDGGDSGLALADVSGLQSALSKERNAARDAAKKLKAFDSLDPQAAREALEFKQRFDSGELSDEAKTRLTNAEKALADKFEAQRQQLTQAQEQLTSNFQQRESMLLTELRGSKVAAAVRAAIATHNGNTRLLEPVVTGRVKLVEEDGKFIVQVLGDNEQPLLSRKTGATTELMSIDEYVGSLRDSKDYAPAFNGSGSSGGGSSPTGSRQSPGAVTLTQEQAKDRPTYLAAQKRATEAGVQLVISE